MGIVRTAHSASHCVLTLKAVSAAYAVPVVIGKAIIMTAAVARQSFFNAERMEPRSWSESSGHTRTEQ